ncbi:MAG: sugar ABC transporter ATP-binding protein [Planctomycetota bacterium]|nr:MAG: sugar ABC transporter ATP-binding protein [Planctomycetota bacterium]
MKTGANRSDTPILQVDAISKRFGGVQALDGVSLSVFPGRVHAVIGENGAGKSTLMKILAGVLQPDAGRLVVDDRPTVLQNVSSALGHGIALIHQELNLCDNLEVGANIFLGREPRRLGLIDFASIRQQSRQYLQAVGLDISPDTLVSDLTIAQQQMVEIAKALSVDARVLIMDEPTSSLSQREAEALFQVIDKLRAEGVAVIYISHRLGEVQRLADEVTVLRDGRNAGRLAREEISHDRMVQLMVGRDISQFYARRPHAIGQPVLELRGLRTLAWPQHPIDLTVHAGEMVGLAGLVGAGRSELLNTVFGVAPAVGGQVKVGGRGYRFRSCADAIEAGIALVPEDRKQQGLILEMAVRTNIGLPGLARHKVAGVFQNRRREIEDTAQMIDQLRIKVADPRQRVQDLSGGNQQKVVIGKWLSMHPDVLLLDEPTRGVDIGAKQEIYRLMEELAERGVAILFASSEMEEVISMSDRVLVMHEGRLMGELTGDQVTEENIMHLATGSTLETTKA